MDDSGTVRKKVDESWKESVTKQKTAPVAAGATPQPALPPETSFETFISSLGMQTVQALNEGHFDQARYLIDIIRMLAEKTKAGLTLEEAQGLQELLYQLQLQFVKKSQPV